MSYFNTFKEPDSIDDLGPFMDFPERPLDEIWTMTPNVKSGTSTTGRLMPLSGFFKRVKEEEEIPDEISNIFQIQQDELFKTLDGETTPSGKNTVSPLPEPTRQRVPESPLDEQTDRKKSVKKDAKRDDKFLSSPDGKKLLAFRAQYLNWCDKLKIVPASELLRAMKTALRNQTALVRLSICHAAIDDLHIQALIHALKVNDQINEILLNHNAISDKGAIMIAETLLKTQSITSLELFGNKIGDDSQKSFSDLLKMNSSIKRLKLGDNLITSKGAELLSVGLELNRGLTQLHLGGNKIEQHGLSFLAKALVGNKTLTSLGLRDNSVGPEGISHLAETLQASTCELSDIQLKGNLIGPKGANYLSSAVQLNRSLKVLELQTNLLGPEGVKVLCEALKENQSVHALNFNDNELGDDGAEYISFLLRENPIITTLGLANNKIRKKGAQALADALACKNSSVTGLDLGNNELGNAGTCALAEALEKNSSLTSLDLRSCEIHLKGVMGLSEMAKVNTTLRHLDIGNNFAKNSGAMEWANVLSTNASLTRLCLTDNQIYHEGGEALARALQTNFTLRNFSYGGQGPSANRIDSSIRRVIDGIIAENKKNWEEQEAQALLTPNKVVTVNRTVRNGQVFKSIPSTTGLPNWFNSSPSCTDSNLEGKLAIIFTNGMLKAENPKFPGSFFIGNVYNTLRKVYPELQIDEIQLVQFAYNNPKYSVHISREMVKTQIKYIGDSTQQQVKTISPLNSESRSPLFRESPNLKGLLTPVMEKKSPLTILRESPNEFFKPNLSIFPKDIGFQDRTTPTKSPIQMLRESPREVVKSPIALLKESPREISPTETESNVSIPPIEDGDQWDHVLLKSNPKKGLKFGVIGQKVVAKKKKPEELETSHSRSQSEEK